MLSYRHSEYIGFTNSWPFFFNIYLAPFMEISHTRVEMFEGKLKELEAEAGLLHQQLDGKRRELKDAWSKAERHQEMAVIFKHMYMAAIEKVRRTHGQLEHLQEELQYSQQQVTQHFISISFKHSTFDCVSLSCSAKRIPISNPLSAGRPGWDDAALPGEGQPMGKHPGGPGPVDGWAGGQSEPADGESAKSRSPHRPDGNPAGAGDCTQTAGRRQSAETYERHDSTWPSILLFCHIVLAYMESLGPILSLFM